MVVLATRGHVWPSQKAHQEPYPEGLAIYCASYYGLHVVCDGRGPTAGSIVGRAMPRRANENPAKGKQTVDQTCQEPVTDSGGGAALATASRDSSRQSGNRAAWAGNLGYYSGGRTRICLYVQYAAAVVEPGRRGRDRITMRRHKTHNMAVEPGDCVGGRGPWRSTQGPFPIYPAVYA